MKHLVHYLRQRWYRYKMGGATLRVTLTINPDLGHSNLHVMGKLCLPAMSKGEPVDAFFERLHADMLQRIAGYMRGDRCEEQVKMGFVPNPRERQTWH